MKLHRTRHLLAAAIFALSLSAAKAHPHVFVISNSEVQFDANGKISGIRHIWRFDEAFSSMATMGMKKESNGTYSDETLKPLSQVNIESLQEYGYFTYLKAGKAELALEEPKDYGLTHDGKALTLSFTLPLKEAILPKEEVTLEIYDKLFFVNFALNTGDAVTLKNAPATCAITISRPKPASVSRLSQLSESFFDKLSKSNGDIDDDLANKARIKCGG